MLRKYFTRDSIQQHDRGCRTRLTRVSKSASYHRNYRRSKLSQRIHSIEFLEGIATMHPEHTSIGELAYLLWQARGCPQGTAHEDWLEAERQLREAQAAARTEARTEGTAAALESAAEPEARIIEETLVVESRRVDDSLRDTFPASDPPASQMPDEPPANADEKWKAAATRKRRPRTRAQQSKSDPSKPNDDARR
jgi:hypothetical protein